MKYPIGIQDFEKLRTNGYSYVDKSRFVYKLATEGEYYFLSRPRRFGKSLFLSTLEAYFQGKKELFEGLAIYDLETDWKKYPIFHIDLNTANFREKDSLYTVLNDYLTTWESKYGARESEATLALRFKGVIARAAEKEGCGVVILIDEYDKPLLDVLDQDLNITINGQKRKLEEWNREVLKGFYSVFKAADADLQFVLLTGVTKFSQVSVFSGFNQPDDISMDEHYEALCGITEEELYSTFEEQIKVMAVRYKTTEEGMKYKLKRKFDGYHFSSDMLDIYNPFSILNSLSKKRLSDFWFRTGTPTYLVRLLSHFKENLNALTGKYYPTSSFLKEYPEDVVMRLC